MRQSSQKQGQPARPESDDVLDEQHGVVRGLVEVFNENFTDTDEQASQNMQINVSGFVEGYRLPVANSKIPGTAESAPELPLRDQDKFCNIDNDIQIFSNPLSLPTEPSSRQKQQQNQ